MAIFQFWYPLKGNFWLWVVWNPQKLCFCERDVCLWVVRKIFLPPTSTRCWCLQACLGSYLSQMRRSEDIVNQSFSQSRSLLLSAVVLSFFGGGGGWRLPLRHLPPPPLSSKKKKRLWRDNRTNDTTTRSLSLLCVQCMSAWICVVPYICR